VSATDGLHRPFSARVLAALAALAWLLAAPAAGAVAPAPPDDDAARPGDVVAQIHHGADAADGTHPWMVALVRASVASAADGQFCGGTLISPTRVVTAAHCTIGRRARDIAVVAGATDLRRATAAHRHPVAVVSLHPQAVVNDETEEYRYDVSVLELARPVPDARPIPVLAPEASAALAPGTALRVTGWGSDEHDDYPTRLQAATARLRSDAACAAALGRWYIPVDMLCALGVSGSTVSTFCDGDSGGSLTTIPPARDARTPAGWALIGVVSWANECDDPSEPGVYARLGSRPLYEYVTGAAPAPQPERVAGTVTLAGTPRVGGRVTCTADAALAFSPADAAVTIRIRLLDDEDYPKTVATGTPAAPPAYTLTSAAVGKRVGCDAIATVPGTGGHGRAAASRTLGPVTAASSGGGSSGSAGTGGSGSSGGRDTVAPRITSVRSTCRRRRCTLTVTVADPAPSAGIARVDATLRRTVSRPCVRGGRRTTCRRTVTQRLRAVRLAGSTRRFRVRTPTLAPRPARRHPAAGRPRRKRRAHGHPAHAPGPLGVVFTDLLNAADRGSASGG
jgi:hypothetical protein